MLSKKEIEQYLCELDGWTLEEKKNKKDNFCR